MTSIRIRRPRHLAVAVGLFLIIGLGVTVGPAGPAGAHPYLVQVVPGPGTALPTSPPEIVLAFSEAAVLEGSSLRLEDGGGRRLVTGPLRKPEGSPGLAAAITDPLASAVYKVHWVVLGDDGHTSAGDFAFAVAGPDGRPPVGAEQLAATGGPADQAAARDGALRVTMRWIGLLGAALLLGAAVLATRLRAGVAPDVAVAITRRLRSASAAGWLLALAGALAAMVSAANAGAGSAKLSIALSTTTGTFALVRLAGITLAGLATLAGRGGRSLDLLGAAGALYLGAEALSGHLTGVTDGRVVASASQTLHLLSGGLWVGGLLVSVWAVLGVPGDQRAAVWSAATRAFSRVAGVSAVVVIGTGTFAAIREVDHTYFLRHTAYGQFLLAKLALVAVMLVLGGVTASALRTRRRPAGAARQAAATTRLGNRIGRSTPLLRVEAVLGVAVLLLAADLAGLAQGRGQPLPAQRGSVLAGPAFANAVVGDGLVRVALAPAAPGRNRLTLLPTFPPGGVAPGTTTDAPPADATADPPGVAASSVTPGVAGGGHLARVSLTCACAAKPVTATLTDDGDALFADVELPAAGVWQAALDVAGQASVAPVALRVDDGAAPGAAPVVVAAPADLSGKDGRRCRSLQLGLVLALGFKNAEGGVNGRKVVVWSQDDGGQAARAKALGEEMADRGVHVAAPCGTGSGAATRALAESVPVVVADPQTPIVDSDRVFRTAGDPYAEGWAVGRTLAQRVGLGGGATVNLPMKVAVVADAGDPTTDRAVAGLKAALAVAPTAAEAVEKVASADTSGYEVSVLNHQAGTPLTPTVLDATDNTKFAATLLRADPSALGPALDAIGDDRFARTNAVFTGNRAFDEGFYQSSRLGRRGDVLVFGEVAPDSQESLLYTKLIQSIFPGERPTIDGLRGFMAGRAIAAGLTDGASPAAIAATLRPLGPFSDGLVSGWSPGAPAAGSWRFFLFKGTFINSSLKPGAKAEPGRFFEEGAWNRVVSKNIGLCAPQTTLAPEPCEAR